jgi:hypothetical protein
VRQQPRTGRKLCSLTFRHRNCAASSIHFGSARNAKCERERLRQNLTRAMKISCSLIVILLFPLLVNAYTWQFTSQPRQCQDVTLSVQGSGGQPPYSLLIIPTGPSPLPNNTEVRSVQNIPFSGTSTTLIFNLNYPEYSSFVAVVRSYLLRHIFSAISSYRRTLFAGQ